MDELELLKEIKSALWILIYLVGIGVSLILLLTGAALYKIIKHALDNTFQNSAWAMYKKQDYDALIEYCHERLKKKPDEAYCYWFLGKSHYQKQEFEEALINFNKTIEIYPTWEEEWVSPYFKKIKAAKSVSNAIGRSKIKGKAEQQVGGSRGDR